MRRFVFLTGVFFSLTIVSSSAQLIAPPEKFQPSLDAAVKRVPVKVPALTTAPDVKTTLYRMADALGMLRGAEEEDGVLTLDFWAAGTVGSGPQACKATSYRGSVRFDVPGMRVDYTCATAGPSTRVVQVVAGPLSWNESQPGINPTPALDTAQDRLTLFWSLPQSVVKAATAAGQATKVTLEGGVVTVAFPLPAPLGGTARVALNTTDAEELTMDDGHKYQLSYWIDRVELRVGDVVTETTFSGGYRDRNEPDYRSDVTFPGRLVQKRGGVTVLDLTIQKTNTYNPYVVMPVPEAVRKAAPASSPTR